MQRLQDRVVDQQREAGAIGRGPRLLRQRLQHAPRVVRAPEERAVEPFGRRLPGALPGEREQAAEQRAGQQPHRQLIAGQIGDAADDPHEAERHSEADQNRQRHHPAADQHIARASPQECRDLHRPMLDDGVAERDGNGEQRQDGQRPCQRRHGGRSPPRQGRQTPE